LHYFFKLNMSLAKTILLMIYTSSR
jgi:hypothetical protein